MSTDKTLRFYLLAVCFVAMVCAAITTGMVLYKVVKIAAPELTLDAWSYSAHSTTPTTGRKWRSRRRAPSAPRAWRWAPPEMLRASPSP